MDKYYQILNLKPGASQLQIKNAYRELARKYHPDVSPSPDAHDRFIEIAEAYEALKNGGKASYKEFQQEWDDYDVEAIRREKAREYARMSYENFKKANEAFQKSWYYRPVKILVQTTVLFAYVISALMFLSPLIGYMIWGTNSLFVSIVMFLLSAHVFRAARDLQKESKPYFRNY
jgi:curved DNA-binding protein CbpA